MGPASTKVNFDMTPRGAKAAASDCPGGVLVFDVQHHHSTILVFDKLDGVADELEVSQHMNLARFSVCFVFEQMDTVISV